jgi:hypothetical protein
MYRFVSLIFFCLSHIVYSQNKELLFGFDEIPQSNMLNPGSTIRYNKHFGIPLLSHIHFNVGIAGFSVFDIFADDGRDINTKIQETITKLTNNDFITINQQLEIINFGWRKNETTYFSAGLYQEFDFINYFPKDLAVLAWEGNANHINESFNLSDLNIKGELLSVYHFGINKQINNKLTVGIRAKLYNSVFNFQSINNQGSFTTRTSTTGSNFYEHILNANIKVQTSGIASLLEDDNSDARKDIKKIRNRFILSGNLGLGVDVGLTYKLNKQWQVSASLMILEQFITITILRLMK